LIKLERVKVNKVRAEWGGSGYVNITTKKKQLVWRKIREFLDI